MNDTQRKERIVKLAQAAIQGDKSDWNMDINKFDWVPGVGLNGIYQGWKATGETALRDFLIQWAADYLSHAYDQLTVNSTAPMLTIIQLWEETKDPEYLKVCKDIAEYIVNEAPRTREGGLEHTVTEAVPGFSEQIWADTLFMSCLFLTHMGKAVDPKYADFAVEQLKIHLRLLGDPESGLFFHAWNCAQKSHMSAIRWGRANAWILYSATEIIHLLGDFAGIDAVRDRIRQHIEALQKLQREDGAFGTILDDPTSYDEASATAGIAAGIKRAVALGIVPEDTLTVFNRSIDYLNSVTDENGLVRHVSTGTPVMPDADAYKAIPGDMPTLYGQGLTLCALSLI